MTRAPLRAAYSKPEAIPHSEPLPDAASTFTGIRLERQATPATPNASSPRASIVPEVCVPCPWSSAVAALPAMKFQPCTSSARPLPSSSTPFVARSRPLASRPVSPGFVQMFGARSPTLAFTPVSTSATTIAGEPVVTAHAAGAEIFGIAQRLA